MLLQMHGRLKASFGKEVSLVEMFRHPTVATLAELFTVDQAPAAFGSVGVRARKQGESLGRQRRRNQRKKEDGAVSS